MSLARRAGGVALTAAVAGVFLASSAPALSPEDENAHPYPPGEYAALTKRTCTGCHDDTMVTETRYDMQKAVEYYRSMVGNPETDTAKKVIQYLTNVLGN